MTELPSIDSEEGLKAVREGIHDAKQARRRTPAQNIALIALVVALGEEQFGYTQLPERGGDLTVRGIKSGRMFLIRSSGVTSEIEQ